MPNVDINEVYMNIASEISRLSYAKRKKVGCIIIKDSAIISMGYNGTPSGFNNDCEFMENGQLVTNSNVLHAESNAISKVAKSHNSSDGSSLYVTVSPCIECSKLIIQAGIKKVYYKEEYRINSGLQLLKKAGIQCFKL